MTRRLRAPMVVGFVFLLFSSTLAAASSTDNVDTEPVDDGFGIYTQETENTDGPPVIENAGNDEGAPAVYNEIEVCARGSETACYQFAVCPDGSKKFAYSLTDPVTGDIVASGDTCPSDNSGAPPQITGRMVAAAFRRIPLPGSDLTIQPPGGKTLVNFDTNFYTDSPSTLRRSVRLLGRKVNLRITVAAYTWHFDAETVQSTTSPGAPYPALTITHNYLQTGTYHPSLDTTYTADYQIGHGPWRPVTGSVTIDGTPTRLRAIEARPILVAYDR